VWHAWTEDKCVRRIVDGNLIKGSLEVPRRRWEDNIKMDFKRIRY